MCVYFTVYSSNKGDCLAQVGRENFIETVPVHVSGLNSFHRREEEKIPQTGDTESLDLCG